MLNKFAIIVVPLFGLPKINNGFGFVFEKIDQIFRIIKLDNKRSSKIYNIYTKYGNGKYIYNKDTVIEKMKKFLIKIE